MTRYRSRLVRKPRRPKYVLTSSSHLTPDEAERLASEWKAAYRSRRDVIVMDSGLTVQVLPR